MGLNDLVSETTLKQIACKVSGDKATTVLSWSHEPIDEGLSGASVYRLWYQTLAKSTVELWSLILKVVGPASGSQSPADTNYWKREVLLYQSGLLADLPPTLVAPRCFEVTAHPGDTFCLWLEDMDAAIDGDWSLEQYGEVACHLGQFNGMYLCGHPLPRQDWLKVPDLRRQLQLAEQGISQLSHLSHNPLFTDLLVDDRAGRIRKLWPKRESLLAALDRLPQTFCHGDASRRNLIRRTTKEREQTIALDWGSAGLGIIGEELVSLFASTLKFVMVDTEHLFEMDDQIFAGYMRGLREAGWDGDERIVRFGFTAQAALSAGVADPARKLPSVARRAAALPPDVEPPQLLDAGGPTQAAAVGHYLLNLGDEALPLLDDLP